MNSLTNPELCKHILTEFIKPFADLHSSQGRQAWFLEDSEILEQMIGKSVVFDIEKEVALFWKYARMHRRGLQVPLYASVLADVFYNVGKKVKVRGTGIMYPYDRIYWIAV